MLTRKWPTRIIAMIFAIGLPFLASASQATAETLTSKIFTHITKMETVPIGDVEGHVIMLNVREGVGVFSNGDRAWFKSTQVHDFIKMAGPFDQYGTYTFQDGSTITTHTKGTVTPTQQGVSSVVKFTGDIIAGTGRFQGIKGTMTTSTTLVPAEKGELGPKGIGESTLVYTMPGQ